MIINLEKKSSFEILECFENLDLKDDYILKIQILESDIENIGYKSWVDIAQIYLLKMETPILNQDGTLILKFTKLNTNSSFHKSVDKTTEKYGVYSEFFNIDKNSQFSFLYHYIKALEFIDIESKQKVLNIGINKGDEFKAIQEILTPTSFDAKEFIGIDYSQTAIEYAKDNLTAQNYNFLCADINKIDDLNLGKFNLIISIGTLQSVNIDFKKTFMNLYQNYLEPDGAIVLGFPNCRWVDGQMIYGASVPHYNFSELSTVIKDIYFCKKYLQQKNYRVTITGKDYLFLTARKLG
ncbi:MAG: class I SAM-dependent methyltransferase [Campylobacterota bacterium]|nr:class I SAM-dependent methyltransferase [Campylobacterota bacterium]